MLYEKIPDDVKRKDAATTIARRALELLAGAPGRWSHHTHCTKVGQHG
jgi:hypothetical protein